MSLILKLETMAEDTIEDTIEDTCQEMCCIAERLNVCVEVKFNDVRLISYRGGDPEELAVRFSEQVDGDQKFKLAYVHGAS